MVGASLVATAALCYFLAAKSGLDGDGKGEFSQGSYKTRK
jgi:hypothetical protein